MSPWASTSKLAERGVVVFGLKLEPVSVGHLELLDEIGVDLFGGWTSVEVALISFILSQPQAEARRDVTKWWAPVVLWYLGVRNRSRDHTAEAERLCEWISGHIRGPQPLRDLSGPNSNRQCTAPLHVHLMALAMTRLGMGMDEVRRQPVRLLKQIIMAAAEATGDVEFMSDSNREFIERCRSAEKAEAQAGRN